MLPSGVCQGESVSCFSGLLAEFSPCGCRSPPFASPFPASRGCCIPRLVAPFPCLQSQQRQVGSLFCHCIPLRPSWDRSSTLMTHAISLGLSNLIIQDNLISVSITLPCKVPGIRVWTSLGGHYSAYHSDLGKNLPSDCEG